MAEDQQDAGHFEAVVIGLRRAANQLGLLAARRAMMLKPRVFSVSRMRPSGRGAMEYGSGSRPATTVSMRKACSSLFDAALGDDRRSADLEVRVREVGALLGNEDGEPLNLRVVERFGPFRHAGLRESFGDALADFRDGTAVSQFGADERRALRGALEILSVAHAARLLIRSHEGVWLRLGSSSDRPPSQ